jgi:regulator of chromosome condensation
LSEGEDAPRAVAVAVAAGRYSTAVVLQSGDVVTWGLNLCGAGRGVTTAALLANPAIAGAPRLVRLTHEGGGFTQGGDKAMVVTLGYVHMAVLTATGALYTCDTGFDGYASVRPRFNDLLL